MTDSYNLAVSLHVNPNFVYVSSAQALRRACLSLCISNKISCVCIYAYDFVKTGNTCIIYCMYNLNQFVHGEIHPNKIHFRA